MKREHTYLTKIYSFLTLDALIFLSRKKKTVIVGGCFDVFHYGHFIFLKKAKEQGEFLIVLLESDEFIRLRKKRKPIHTQRQRSEILAAFEMIDAVVTLPFLSKHEDYFKLIEKIRPKVIAITDGDTQKVNKEQQAISVKAELKVVSSKLEPFSSSKILKHAIISGN